MLRNGPGGRRPRESGGGKQPASCDDSQAGPPARDIQRPDGSDEAERAYGGGDEARVCGNAPQLQRGVMVEDQQGCNGENGKRDTDPHTLNTNRGADLCQK